MAAIQTLITHPYYHSVTMPQHIQTGVRQVMEDPSRDEYVNLIVGVEDSESKKIASEVEEAGGTVEKQLPFDYLAVTIEEVDLERLTSLDGITSLEIEGTSKTMSSENFQSRPNMTL